MLGATGMLHTKESLFGFKSIGSESSGPRISGLTSSITERSPIGTTA